MAKKCLKNELSMRIKYIKQRAKEMNSIWITTIEHENLTIQKTWICKVCHLN